ncbi:MAG: radical SAM protein [Bacteroidaceae bacterium]|nr:radical SAM protein [Bacteroidaceae bacterium]
MSTIIYDSPVFGPIHSRRLGISLGINLLPKGGKFCSFDCIYCECGLNSERRTKNPLPTADEVVDGLKEKLQALRQEGIVPDVLTFAGNGEPTLHPHFPEIVGRVREVRDRECPSAKMSILSNATQIRRPEIREALMHFDNNILKLDTVSPTYINNVDRPQGHYDVEEQIRCLELFGGKCIIQTMLMRGTFGGFDLDNTGEAYVAPYLEALKRIKPRAVMLYTLDRETPVAGLEKASPETMQAIAERIRQLGIEARVSS